MSKVNFTNGKFFLQDGANEELLLDVVNWSVNKSCVHSTQLNDDGTLYYPLLKTVNRLAKNIFRNTPESMSEAVIFLRTVARLLVKPQIHNVLRIGTWSPLNEALAEMLPPFNPANKLYCLSKTRPLGKVPSVIFLCAEGGDFPLPENKFDTIIYSRHETPPAGIFLSAKDFGKIYFAALTESLEDFLRPTTKIFPLTEKISLFETELTPTFRQEIFRRTSQGRLESQKLFVMRTVDNFTATAKKINAASKSEKMFMLDKYLAELSRAEKVLAEIFPSLHGDTLKFNFNLFKEFLLDLRLGTDAQSRKISSARAVRQHGILMQDLNNS